MDLLAWRNGLSSDELAAVQTALQPPRSRDQSRILAWGRGDDVLVVGLIDRMMVRRGDRWDQVPWHTIERGGWDWTTSTLTWRTGQVEDEVALTVAGKLPELFRERVEASIVVQRVVELGRRRRVHLSLRRALGPDGGVTWVTRWSDPADAHDPEAAAMADAELSRLRAEYEMV